PVYTLATLYPHTICIVLRSPLFPYTPLFRSRVERAADEPGRTGVVGEQVAGLDVRADTVDRYAVEIGDELLGSGIERRGHGDPRSEEHSLNSSHVSTSYAVFCLKKNKINNEV